VKAIGDAVMLAGPEPAGLLLSLLALMDAAEAEGEGFPAVHAGVAHGVALRRWGDYYGECVNLAARLTERARPSSLITHAEVRERLAADERFGWSDAGAKRLKGVSDPVHAWRVRREPVR
jgi:adenylate cyclase